MNITENDFFRQATLRICGNLKIEEGLRSCIEYLSQYIPADRLYLERHDHGPGEMRPLARASIKKGERIDMLLRLSEEAQATLRQRGEQIHLNNLPPFFIHNKPQEEPIARCFLEALGEPSSSVLWLPLIVGDQHTGALILLAEGNNRFTETHARLFATLREPFFIAMSNAMKHERVIDDNQQLRGELLRISGDKIVGADSGLRKVMQQVRQVAPTESIVLLTGETGVGKDLIANAIHLASPRREGPFVPVNCGAIPEALLGSELFGHEKGGFTGALSMKRGRFERADKGTILLDEIGEMSIEAQVHLLRVIQHREIERVGGTKRIPVDIRIIASTNKDLSKMVDSGRFRKDLWFRLNVFPIMIPPLRQRSEDIPALVHYFIDRKSRDLNLHSAPRLAQGAVERLMAYNWPGNVRELENVIERALILNRGGLLDFDHLFLKQEDHNPSVSEAKKDGILPLDDVMSLHIRRALRKTNGKVHGPKGAARLLGINPSTLRSRIKKLGITAKF